jgi:dTDP-4-dehydrorhamnose 3,5-epimerase-like enzyme
MNFQKLVTTLQPVDKNERRTMWEIVNDVSLKRMQAFEFHPSTTAGGNHYHKKLTEYFFVVVGTMTLMVFEDVRTKERAVFKNLGPGSLIIVPTYVAHANCFAPGTVLVAGCTTAFDQNDKDAYPYPLLDEMGNEVKHAEQDDRVFHGASAYGQDESRCGTLTTD